MKKPEYEVGEIYNFPLLTNEDPPRIVYHCGCKFVVVDWRFGWHVAQYKCVATHPRIRAIRKRRKNRFAS